MGVAIRSRLRSRSAARSERRRSPPRRVPALAHRGAGGHQPFLLHLTAQATRGNRQLQTYEFLHATFGEFLVAWLVSRVLNDMLAPSAPGAHPSRARPDDELLYALLSFAALTASSPVVMFLDDLISEMGGNQRTALADVLLRLHAESLYSRPESAYGGYEPLRLTVTTRHAAWSANLVLLAVLAAGEITSTQLFPADRDSGLAWRNRALMWRSQLVGRGWEGMYETIALKRIWKGQRREILLWRAWCIFPAARRYLLDIYPDARPGRRPEPWPSRTQENIRRASVYFALAAAQD